MPEPEPEPKVSPPMGLESRDCVERVIRGGQSDFEAPPVRGMCVKCRPTRRPAVGCLLQAESPSLRIPDLAARALCHAILASE